MAVIFHHDQGHIPLRYMPTQMGHPHTITRLKTDNTTANSFVHDNITQKKSKSWDILFYWLRNEQQNQNFDIYWYFGHNNLADDYKKYHTAQLHKDIRKTYVRVKLNCMPSQYVKCMPSCIMQGYVGTRPCVQRMTRLLIHFLKFLSSQPKRKRN